MKKGLLFFAFLLLSGTVYAQEPIQLSGCISGLPESVTDIQFAYVRGNRLAIIKKAPLVNGCFETTWSRPERGIFIAYLDGSHSVDFVISNSDISLSGSYDNFTQATFTGSGNTEFVALKAFLSSAPETEAIRSQLLAVQDESLREFLLPQLLPFHSDTSVYWLRSHFWDYTNLNSPSTLINPFFQKNQDLYFEQVLGHNPDTIIATLATLFSQPMHPEVRKVLISTATYKYETSKVMGEDAVFVWLAQNFYTKEFATWMSAEELGNIQEKASGLASELIGDPAPDFAFDTQNGRMKLSEVDAKITILYFWDSDCGHCIKETPRLKKLYDDYKDRGVEVVAITLENEFTNWEAFIEKHELNWINGFESNFDRPNFLWYYYIQSTPKKLVLDENKRIIGKNLDVETTLRTFLDDQLAPLEK